MQDWYKNIFVDTTVPLQRPYMQIWTALLNRDYTEFGPELLASWERTPEYSVSYWTNLLSMKTYWYEAGYVWC